MNVTLQHCFRIDPRMACWEIVGGSVWVWQTQWLDDLWVRWQIRDSPNLTSQPPRQAEALCEEDDMCGGFTFRGSKLMDRQYNIYFFHLLINVESDRDSLKWMIYKSRKSFLKFPGTFSEKGSSSNWKISGNDGERTCVGNQWHLEVCR